MYEWNVLGRRGYDDCKTVTGYGRLFEMSSDNKEKSDVISRQCVICLFLITGMSGLNFRRRNRVSKRATCHGKDAMLELYTIVGECVYEVHA